MKNAKVVSAGIVVGLCFSVANAIDFSSIGKGLEVAQNAGLVKTGVPTEKQFEDKIKKNAKANVGECKKFYHKAKIAYQGMFDSMLANHEKEAMRDLLGEYDRQNKKALESFDLKPFMKKYEKDKEDSDAKYEARILCKTILQEGLSEEERSAFRKETKKYE